jgi:hypothetical protein
MKKLILFALLMVSLTTFSQTTLDEYNYVTKGYKIQLESGLDMKKGYSMVKVGGSYTEERKATFYRFNKQGTTRGQARLVAYMIEYDRKGKPKEYYCVPHKDSEKEIKSLFFQSLNTPNADNSAKLLLFVNLLTEYLDWNSYNSTGNGN